MFRLLQPSVVRALASAFLRSRIDAHMSPLASSFDLDHAIASVSHFAVSWILGCMLNSSDVLQMFCLSAMRAVETAMLYSKTPVLEFGE